MGFEQPVPESHTPEQLAKMQRERQAAKMQFREDFAASDLLEGSLMGGNTTEEIVERKAAEAARQEQMTAAFREELALVEQIITDTEAEIARLEEMVSAVEAKLVTARPDAEIPYKLSLERSRSKIADLKAKPLYDGANLAELITNRDALQLALTDLAPENGQSN
jgi:hypothetical protein